MPTDIKPRVLMNSIYLEDGTASLELAIGVAGNVDLETACLVVAKVGQGQGVATWRAAACQRHTLSEMDRMASAFEYEELQAALKPRSCLRKGDR